MKLCQLGRELLITLGEDPDRAGLRDTPARWARAWTEFLEYDPGTLTTHFEAVQADQMVALRGIEVHSMCEHHLLPFRLVMSVAYLSEKRVVGISKLARVCHLHAHKLQLQERIVDGVARDIQALAGTRSVGVVAHGRHGCLESRGIRTPSEMVTSALFGAFRDDPRTRAEFFALANGHNK